MQQECHRNIVFALYSNGFVILSIVFIPVLRITGFPKKRYALDNYCTPSRTNFVLNIKFSQSSPQNARKESYKIIPLLSA
jgi:hypothetical protein